MRSEARRHAAGVVAAALLTCASAAPAPQVARSVEIAFELTLNHVYFPVAVEDQPPSWFLLDTGAATTVLEQKTADATKLRPHGKVQARGMGPGTIDGTMFRDIDLRFGGLHVRVARAPALSLRDLSLLEGRMIEGIAGFDILKRFAIEIDYEKRTLRFHDPAHYTAPPSAVALPITFNQTHPVINARLTLHDGRAFPIKLKVDTGARGAISLNRPFAEKYGVYEALQPGLEGSFGAGVGGMTQQRVGRVKQIAIDRFAFKAPVVTISRDSAGAGVNKDVDGLVGGEILRRFTLTVDYARNRLLITPNRNFGEPFEFEMAGILLRAVDEKFDRFVVRQVIEGSPAKEAGIETGDELLSIDRVPASTMSIESIRALFRQPDKTYRLRIRRMDRELEKTITTRRLL